jgi:hypothetical protein
LRHERIAGSALVSSPIDAVACPSCARAEARSAFVKSGYPFRRCAACGLVFASPYPTAEQLAAYYNDPARTPTEDDLNKAASSGRRAALRPLRFFRYVVPGKRVLDLGCGGGVMVEAFARLGARAVTKPGGYLHIASPDAGHELVPANIAEWDQVAPPEQIQLFNRENARILFARYGLALVKAYPNKKPGLSLLFRQTPSPQRALSRPRAG